MTGCSCPSSPVCETTLPSAKSDASASRMKGLVGSTCAKIDAVVNARFKLSNASAASELHING